MPKLITSKGVTAVSAILFDKDGTLLQFVSLWGSWSHCFLEQFTRQLEQRGLAFPASSLPSLLGTVHDAEGSITDYDRNGPLAMGTMNDLYAILAWQAYQLGLSWAESKELVDLSREEADALLERTRPVLPLPGLLRFLDDCAASGMPMAVVTADETAAAEAHLRWLGIRGYFSAVIGTDQVERGKPFPDMALLACERLGVEPRAAAVIGDTNGDMRMAKAAGAAVAIGIAGAVGVAADAVCGVAGVTAGAVDGAASGAAGAARGVAGVTADAVDGAASGAADAARGVAGGTGISRTAETTAARELLPDADCIVQSYAELSIERIVP
ncbi:HAD family hydrolase [Paenibacillus sp. HW567]|uniref:HAD family hydrolase n=1 Tax=Paenibacillus sp. HW567 TaxID=1034769 RepID=UPI00036249FF|nr:HAD-IA family hydrolase [Paenibacillus sp. HW567]